MMMNKTLSMQQKHNIQHVNSTKSKMYLGGETHQAEMQQAWQVLWKKFVERLREKQCCAVQQLQAFQLVLVTIQDDHKV